LNTLKPFFGGRSSFAVEWEILDRNPAAARFRAAKAQVNGPTGRDHHGTASRGIVRWKDLDLEKRRLTVNPGDISASPEAERSPG